jgi:hypothetical protein
MTRTDYVRAGLFKVVIIDIYEMPHDYVLRREVSGTCIDCRA